MKTINNWYNPKAEKTTKKSRINLTSLFSWIAVLVVIVSFWASVAVVYKKDYVPHAIARIENKEKKILAAHKTVQKKIGGTHTLI